MSKKKPIVFKDSSHGRASPPVYSLPYRRHDLAPKPTGARLELVGSGRCKFIHGVPGWGEWEMCGHPTHNPAESWCSYHIGVVYQDKAVVDKRMAAIEHAKNLQLKAPLKKVA